MRKGKRTLKVCSQYGALMLTIQEGFFSSGLPIHSLTPLGPPGHSPHNHRPPNLILRHLGGFPDVFCCRGLLYELHVVPDKSWIILVVVTVTGNGGSFKTIPGRTCKQINPHHQKLLMFMPWGFHWSIRMNLISSSSSSSSSSPTPKHQKTSTYTGSDALKS